MSSYSRELKEKLVAKALMPNAMSIAELARQANIAYQTLYNWVKIQERRLPTGNLAMSENTPPIRPQNWSSEAKLKAVIDTALLSEEELGAYCRRMGLFTSHIQEWKQRCLEGMKLTAVKNQSAEVLELKAELKQVQKDLNRKDKALAETTALLILKKKANLIWGDGEED